MKKKLLLIGLIFLLTGCGSAKLKSEKDVIKYLDEEFPNEEFEIVDYETIILDTVASCDEGRKGKTWTVKSKDTGIEFQVEDKYDFNSFVCEYMITNNYFESVVKNFVDNEDDYRVVLSITNNINFNLNDFNSEEELASFVYDIFNRLTNDENFTKYRGNRYFYFNIYDEDDIICSISIDKIDSELDILDAINEER